MGLHFSGIILTVLLVVAFCNVGLIPGASAAVDNAKIRDYLNKLMEEKKARGGIVTAMDREAILNQYVDDASVEHDTAIQQISLTQEPNSLGHEASCEISTQQVELLADTLKMKFDADELKDYYKKTFLDTGKKHCNFIGFLVCKESPAASGTHKCVCPETMVWKLDKCVFKLDEKCHEVKDVNGDWFYTWDYFEHSFISEITPNCEGSSRCYPDSGVCQSKPFEFADINQISNFFEKRFKEDSAVQTEAHKKEQMEKELEDLTTDPDKRSNWYFFSLEFHMDRQLVEHGRKCDGSKDSQLGSDMKTYHERVSTYVMSGRDYLREKIQRKILGFPTQTICNHFKFLKCSSGTCDCKEGLKFESGVCKVKHASVCANKPMKLFNFPFRENAAGETEYFLTQELECEVGSLCMKRIPMDPASTCVEKKDASGALLLEQKLNQKFSIPLNGKCVPAEHEELFKLGSKTRTTFEEAADEINKLLAKPTLQYCKLLDHMTCSKSGTCTCIPPTLPSSTGSGTCHFPEHHECSKGLSPGEIFKAVQNLVLPLDGAGYKALTDLCPVGADCAKKETFSASNLCYCPERIFGELCQLKPNQHVSHIDVSTLPALQTLEGRNLISEFHSTLYQLENGMTLKFDQACDSTVHKELAEVLDTLDRSRDHCVCTAGSSVKDMGSVSCTKWSCNGKQEMSESDFKALLGRSKALVSKALCNWNMGLRCVDGKCGCPANFFNQAGTCHVELGGNCKKEGQGRFRSEGTKCRHGLECHTEKEDELVGKCTFDEKTKQNLITAVEELRKKIMAKQTLKPGHHCNYDEPKLKESLESSNMALNFLKEAGKTKSEEEMKIRILQDLQHTLRAFANEKVSFCKASAPCENNKCKIINPSRPKIVPPPPPPASASQFHGVQIKYLVVPALIFVLLRGLKICSNF